MSLVASQYDELYTSGQQFRVYSKSGAFCRFGSHAVPATVVNATRLLCSAPSSVSAGAASDMKVDVSVSFNGQVRLWSWNL